MTTDAHGDDLPHIVHRAGDTTFYTEGKRGATRSRTTITVDLDWLQLAKQKLALLEVMDLIPSFEGTFECLVQLLDYIQDQAQEDGHPVVWFAPNCDFGKDGAYESWTEDTP